MTWRLKAVAIKSLIRLKDRDSITVGFSQRIAKQFIYRALAQHFEGLKSLAGGELQIRRLKPTATEALQANTCFKNNIFLTEAGGN